jgi:hypothetical protein
MLNERIQSHTYTTFIEIDRQSWKRQHLDRQHHQMLNYAAVDYVIIMHQVLNIVIERTLSDEFMVWTPPSSRCWVLVRSPLPPPWWIDGDGRESPARRLSLVVRVPMVRIVNHFHRSCCKNCNLPAVYFTPGLSPDHQTIQLSHSLFSMDASSNSRSWFSTDTKGPFQ